MVELGCFVFGRAELGRLAFCMVEGVVEVMGGIMTRRGGVLNGSELIVGVEVMWTRGELARGEVGVAAVTSG